MKKVVKKTTATKGTKGTKAKAKAVAKGVKVPTKKAPAKGTNKAVKKSTKVEAAPKKKSKGTKASVKAPVVKRGGYARELGITATKEAMTHTQVIGSIAEEMGLEPKAVKGVIENYIWYALSHLMPGGTGEFMIPGLVKMVATTKKVKAIKPGTMVRNPSTGEMIESKGRPASIKYGVKATAVGKARKISA